MIRDYYQAGAHIYEISRGKGRPNVVLAFEETPQGDGMLLWSTHLTLLPGESPRDYLGSQQERENAG